MCHTANIVKQYTSDEVSFIKFEVYCGQGETVASVSTAPLLNSDPGVSSMDEKDIKV